MWVSVAQSVGVDTNRPFQLQKRSQLFIRTRDETLAIAPMRISDENCSSFTIHG
jgi:hypothetical protein